MTGTSSASGDATANAYVRVQIRNGPIVLADSFNGGLLYVDKTKPAWAVDSDREMETTAFFDPPGKAPPLLTLRAILQCEAAITGPLPGSATVDVAGDTTLVRRFDVTFTHR